MPLNPYSVLRLWYGKDDEWLSHEELLKRKNSQEFDKRLSETGTRQFYRHLDSLTRMHYLVKKVDLNRHTWYSKTERGKRKSFAAFLADWMERIDIGENRDLYGVSLVYSEPALTSFVRKEEIEELYRILDEANARITDKIWEILIKSRLRDLPDKERENAVFYSKMSKTFIEMTRRLEKSGMVKTRREDRKASSQLLRQAKLSGFDTVDEFKSEAGWRFYRMFQHVPLTFNDQQEHQDLKNRLRPYEKIFAEIEGEMPRVFCCFYNFKMEELLLSENDLVLTINDIVRPVEEVLHSLSDDQLTKYKARIEKALRSRSPYMPKWTGKDHNLQPKIKQSWDNSTSRKYLQRIRLSIEEKLARGD